MAEIPKQTGPEILNTMAFLTSVVISKVTVESTTLGTKKNKNNQYTKAFLEKPEKSIPKKRKSMTRYFPYSFTKAPPVIRSTISALTA
jgi:hypothetical protein